MTTTLHSASHSCAVSGSGPAPRARTLRLGLLGCGTVGGALARLISDERESIERRTGVRIELAGALVRDVQRDRDLHRVSFTHDAGTLFAVKPDVIVEALGGIDPRVEPARTLVAKSLSRGIPVVSANKTLIAHHGIDLERLARRAGTRLLYEAAICAAIPLLDAMKQLRAEPIRRVLGIVNGTCNAILMRMEKTGCNLDAALAEAQRAGLAEPDPTADLSGRDSAEKLVILARSLGWRRAQVGDVEVRGIESVTPGDLLNASRRGGALRLITRLEADREGSPRLRVEPTLIPRTHPLATVIGADNGVTIDSAWRGEVLFRGRGAGPTPTAAALLGDVLRLTNADGGRRGENSTTPLEANGAFYLRLNSEAAGPNCVLRALRASGIELEHIEFSREGCMVFTQKAIRVDVVRALESLPDPAAVFTAARLT